MPQLQAGTISGVSSSQVMVTLPDGSVVSAIGSGSVGQRVYVRAGVIEGDAPNLPVVVVEI